MSLFRDPRNKPLKVNKETETTSMTSSITKSKGKRLATTSPVHEATINPGTAPND